MTTRDGKKRVAHVGSSTSNTAAEETESVQCDYLSSILEEMDSNDKRIVTYKQLENYRKSKQPGVQPGDLDLNQQESYGSFKLKKKKFPLMAKCQRNLKYLKHNRCMPKPRAHVGSGSKETRLEKISTDLPKKTKYQIKPKRVQNIEPNWHSSLNSEAEKAKPAVNKSNKEPEEIKTQESLKEKKRKHSPTLDMFSDNTVPDSGNESSEESDCFESFIKEQQASIKEDRLERNVERKKKPKRNVFKRIKSLKDLSPWSHSDEEDSCGNSSITALNKSSVANTLPESRERNDSSNSDDETNDNSFQLDFENACDDSSDSCERNNELNKPSVLISNCSIESDDCLILNNSPPELNIRIASVMSVSLRPGTDEVENSESACNLSNTKLIDTNISPEMDGVNNKILLNDLESACQTEVLSHQAMSNFETQPKTSLMIGLEQVKPLAEELDDCIILDDEPQSVSNISNPNMSHNFSNSVRSYHPERVDIKPSVTSSLDYTDRRICTKEINQEQASVASSRFEPNSPTLSNTNVWDVLRSIDFAKLKVLPQSLPAQTSNAVSEGKGVMDVINSSSRSQMLEKSNACPVTSSMCTDSVEIIDLSDEENDRTESSEFHNSQFASRVTASDLDSLDDKQNQSRSIISSNLFILDKSCKQEVSNVELCGVKKEKLCTVPDELDYIAATSLQTLGNSKENDIHKLLELYKAEYQQFLNVRNTGRNLSDGLNLLLNKQVERLMHIKSSIKSIVKHDPCFLKMSKTLKTDLKPIKGEAMVKKEEDYEMQPTQSSESAHVSDTVCSELSMYTDSVLQGVQQLVGNSLPPESSGLRAEKVKEQLRNIKCAQCGETATSACQGCSKVFYCSTECGMSDWERGHSVSCGT